jgi:DNA-binding CsgD family transcriptional regulator/PAS domain-containing protein
MAETRGDLLQALYGAAMGTAAWPDALDALAVFADSRVVTLDTYDLDAHVGQVLAANVVPDPSIEDYNREFGRGNFQIETGARFYRPGKVMRTSDFISQKELLSSEIYNHVYKPMGIRWGTGVGLEVSDRHIAEFTFMRALDAEDHSERELERIRSVAPHLLQAWQGYQHLTRIQDSLDVVSSLWDRFDHAVVVIDTKRRIRFANRLAESLLAAGRAWISRAGRLHMRQLEDDQAFGRQLRTVLEGEPRLLRLSFGALGNELVSTLIRLDSSTAALVVTDPARNHPDLRQGLMMRFHLTPAEAEVVSALVDGEPLRRFADRQAIAYETARSQLKSAMGKNGWRRQPDMVADVLRALLPVELFRA